MEQIERNIAALGRSRLCEYNLGLRLHRRRRPNCHYAHWLKDLEAPNETKMFRWTDVWKYGQVDIYFWHDLCRCEESERRFRLAFNWEKTHYPGRIPNWAWGLAAYSNLIPLDMIPRHVPNDYDWPRLQNAWYEGLKGAGTRITVRQVLLSPNIPQTMSASSHQRS